MDEVKNSQIFFTRKNIGGSVALATDLYEIESVVTNVSRILSMTTTTGNEHIVEMSPNDCILLTKVPTGVFSYVTILPQSKQVVESKPLLKIDLKA